MEYFFQIFSSRNETKWDFATVYPIPNMPDNSTTEPLYENVPSVTKLVEEMTKSDEISKNDESDTDSGFRISGSFDGHEFNPVPWEGAREIEISREVEISREIEISREVDVSKEVEISKEIKTNEESKEITTEKTKLAEQIQNRSDFRTTMASISKTSTTKLQPVEKVDEIVLKSSNSLVAATTDTQTTMTIYQLIAILLIFCLILLALNVMWNNLFITMLICCITLPILRWLGKV